MAEIFADNGLIIYMPSNEIPTNPYWKAFMQVAVLTETMDIVEGEEDLLCSVMRMKIFWQFKCQNQ